MSKRRGKRVKFNPSPDDLWLVQCVACNRVADFVAQPRVWRQVNSEEVARNTGFLEAVCPDCDEGGSHE